MIRSYLSGSWFSSPASGQPVFDAVTGQEIDRVSSEGADVAGALTWARQRGQALRELTFHQRAALLKALASYLREHREELYELSLRSGATRSDARLDIDGGIAVLSTYASKAKRELPNDTIYVEGPAEVLSKGGNFLGQHILTSKGGISVQINAFNFPVWGPLEKLAPAFLAGMSSLIKPASVTAYLTERLVELILESNLLPEGSLQLLCGGVGDLFDHLGPQDMVFFTGSASTAHRIASHPSLVTNSVAFNAEADSLNCSILGPDGKPGTTQFDAYVSQLVTEMTVKAGQKCTAIRRAFVPVGLVDEVLQAVSSQLEKVIVGNPANQEVTMGPLVSVGQREEVRVSLDKLMAAGKRVFGDPDRTEVRDADPISGAFISPVLLYCSDARRPEPHQIEVFGPVCSVLPYKDTREVIELAALGSGSLAGSIASEDADFVNEVVAGLAPWHGRLLILDAGDAQESTGHGSPLPTLVHGGPGRAGGGEELGGIRAVLRHMQRTAIQASPARLSSLSGTWVAGAPRKTEDRHPFTKSLAELSIGDSVKAGPRRITLSDIEHFASFTGDTFYAHTDEEAARANPFFEGRVAHGYLVLSLAAGLFVDPRPGPVLANYGLDNLRFLTPVYPGDEITVTLTCKQISPREDADYGEVRWDVEVTNSKGDAVAKYDLLTMVAKTWPPAPKQASR
jgi:oxepin-CoA hydrolase/3-oxo-5,6-dehydrosuberyl-CoA semialdehyde dehydrogenase